MYIYIYIYIFRERDTYTQCTSCKQPVCSMLLINKILLSLCVVSCLFMLTRHVSVFILCLSQQIVRPASANSRERHINQNLLNTVSDCGDTQGTQHNHWTSI